MNTGLQAYLLSVDDGGDDDDTVTAMALDFLPASAPVCLVRAANGVLFAYRAEAGRDEVHGIAKHQTPERGEVTVQVVGAWA